MTGTKTSATRGVVRVEDLPGPVGPTDSDPVQAMLLTGVEVLVFRDKEIDIE